MTRWSDLYMVGHYWPGVDWRKNSYLLNIELIKKGKTRGDQAAEGAEESAEALARLVEELEANGGEDVSN